MMIKFVKSLFQTERQRQQTEIDEWLANSDSLQEIEQKQKMISRGEAPWQIQANHNLRGWI